MHANSRKLKSIPRPCQRFFIGLTYCKLVCSYTKAYTRNIRIILSFLMFSSSCSKSHRQTRHDLHRLSHSSRHKASSLYVSSHDSNLRKQVTLFLIVSTITVPILKDKIQRVGTWRANRGYTYASQFSGSLTSLGSTVFRTLLSDSTMCKSQFSNK